MKFLFVIVVLLVVSLFPACESSFAFNNFFKKKPKHAHRTTTTVPATTTKTPPRQAAEKPQLPQRVSELLRSASSEDEFRKSFGLKPLVKKDRVGKEKLSQSADGSLPDPDVNAAWGVDVCKPRLVLINLYEQEYGLVHPRCVVAKRCGGCCVSELQHCVPVDSKEHMVSAYFYSFSGNLEMKSQEARGGSVRRRRNFPPLYEAKIPVRADTRCECQCVKSQSDCNIRQEWKPYHCNCQCLPQYSKGKLNCQYPFQFDAETCKCKCVLPPNNNCEVGKEWSREACKCVCKKKICAKPEVLDTRTCKCKRR